MALIFVLFTSLVLVLLIGTLIYGLPGNLFSGWYQLQKRSVYDSLSLTADFKKDQVLDWVSINKRMMRITVNDRMFTLYVDALLAKIKSIKQLNVTEWWKLIPADPTYQSLRYYLLEIKKQYGPARGISVVDFSDAAEIVLSTDEESLGQDVSWEDFYQKMASGSEEYLGDVHEDQRSLHPVMHFSRLIRNEYGEPIAIFLIEIDASEILTPLLETGVELGTSGEIVLVNQDRMILTYLRHKLPDGRIAEPLKYKNTGVPAFYAAAREDGIIEAPDYRGLMVLAAYRFIEITPDWGWGLVVKEDLSEVFAPIQRTIFVSAAMAGITILLVVLVTIMLASSLTEPLLQASRAAEKYTHGDFNARIDIQSNDEVGTLADSFNSMAARLQDWYGEMEQRVKSRTEEITLTNEQLRKEIEQRKRIENILRETRDYLENLLEYANAPIVVWDAENRITRFNRAFERLSGLNAVDMIGGAIEQMFPAEQKERVSALIHGDGRSERWETVEIPVQHVDGSVRTVLWNTATIFSNNGVLPLATIAQGQDITERKLAEEAQVQLSHELAEKNKELEQIVYVTSHDLRSPLVNIQGFSKELDIYVQDILRFMEHETSPTQRINQILTILKNDIPQALSYIRSSAQKMDGLISGLLKLSRLGRAELNIVSLDMNTLLKHVLSSFEYQIQDKEIQVEVGELPMCMGDEMQINQVFSNLVDNAIKYSYPGRSTIISITGTVARPTYDEIHFPPGTEFAVYCVKDNGIGIANAHLARVFEIFHRLNPQQTEGEGLGLTIVRHILERQHGKIWVESTPDEGSNFFVALPKG